jgi:transcriptional regulator of heat shock response
MSENMNKFDIIAGVEKQLRQRYGEEIVQPIKCKDEEELKKIKKETEEFYDKLAETYVTNRENNKSYLIERTCEICENFSFSARDDVYMIKFKCCFECYVKYLENREEQYLKLSPEGRKEYVNKRKNKTAN